LVTVRFGNLQRKSFGRMEVPMMWMNERSVRNAEMEEWVCGVIWGVLQNACPLSRNTSGPSRPSDTILFPLFNFNQSTKYEMNINITKFKQNQLSWK
jgi:hypothetical protein